MTDRDQVDDGIARYREQLAREADLGRATLDEIEDHLRLLVADLRATGMPAGAAIAEAARRLGEPAALAREHARVRTPFGAKLPRWRALAIIALVLPQLWLAREAWLGPAEAALGLAVCTALLWRSAWARAAMFGVMAWSTVVMFASALLVDQVTPLWACALQLGSLALLAPWRRSELTATGWALALLYPAYCGAAWMLSWQVTGADLALPDARFALVGVVLAGAGLVLRARWAAVAALGAAVLLALWLQVLLGVTYRVPDAAAVRAFVVVTNGAGVAAALGVAVLAWRSARSSLGSLRDVLA